MIKNLYHYKVSYSKKLNNLDNDTLLKIMQLMSDFDVNEFFKDDYEKIKKETMINVCETFIDMNVLLDYIGSDLKTISTPKGTKGYTKVYFYGRYERCEFKGDNLQDAVWNATIYKLENDTVGSIWRNYINQ